MSADFATVVVGGGFAGLAVASRLVGGEYAVIDRGEEFDLGRAYAKVDYGQAKGWRHAIGHLDELVDAEARVFRSELSNNGVALPLSVMSANVYTYVQGGISNWWGGYSARLSRATFERDGEIAWPIGLEMLGPYYEQAEQCLHVHGDPTAEDYSVFGATPGWEYWKDYLKETFPRARVTPEAKNLTDADAQAIGICRGNGHCAICENDAKARPANIFPNVEVFGRSVVKEIVFEGHRAVAIRCDSEGEESLITFDRLVVAAGGLENVALLKRSVLPGEVSCNIGRWYQDHTACEVLCLMPKAFQHYQLGAEGAIEIPELSGYFDGIEVKTLMLPGEMTESQMAGFYPQGGALADMLNLSELARRTARFYLQMEVPPEWHLELRCRGFQSFIHAMPYLRNVPILDSVVVRVMKKMADAGLYVTKVVPHHRYAFGGHHYSGTTPMSRHGNGVVDQNQKVLGTENLYLNGASVMPRCGGSGPTLSIVALGLRLGDHLRELTAESA